MMVLMKTNPGLWHEKRCSEEEAVGALVQCQFPGSIPREGYITGITSGYALSTSKIKEFYILYIPRVDLYVREASRGLMTYLSLKRCN